MKIATQPSNAACGPAHSRTLARRLILPRVVGDLIALNPAKPNYENAKF
jgi:hypothetical protein